MYLINTSFHVHTLIFDEALSRVREEYIPEILQSGVFSEPLLSLILINVDQDCRSFSLQMKAESLEAAQAWLADRGGLFLSALGKQWGDRIVTFTTPMKII